MRTGASFSRGVLVVLALLLMGLVGLVYAPAANYGFSNFDDVLHVQQNPYLQPLEARRIAYFWRYPFNPSPVPGVPDKTGGGRLPYHAIYTPLSFTVHALVASQARLPATSTPAVNAVPPLDAGVFHKFNILLHALNTVLVLCLLQRLLRNSWASLAGALFFALHPAQVEAVAWVTGQNGLLCTFFALLALLLYFASLRHREDAEADDKPKRGVVTSLLAVLCFAAALLAKPSAGVLPAAVLVLDYAYFRRPTRARWLGVLPFAVLTLVSLLINRHMQAGDGTGVPVAAYLRPFVVGDSLTWYLRQLILPQGLVLDYGRRPDWVLTQTWVYIAWLVPAGIALTLWLTRRVAAADSADGQVWRGLVAGLSWFALVLLPTSGIITYYFQIYSSVADRYLYLPLVGGALALAAVFQWDWSVAQSRIARWLAPVLATIVIWLNALLSYGQVHIWQTDVTLWHHTLEHNPRSWIASLSLGRRYTEAGNLDLALTHLAKAKELQPNEPNIRFRLADVFQATGRAADAEKEYRAGLQINPNAAYGYLRLGEIEAKRNKLVEAGKLFETGLKFAPTDPDLLGNYAETLFKLGQTGPGEQIIAQAMQRGFNPGKGYRLQGIARAIGGDLKVAQELLQLSIQYNPAQYESHYNLGLVFQKQREYPAALEAFSNAVTYGPKYAPGYVELGRTYIQLRQPNEAIGPLKDALKLDAGNAAAKKLLAEAQKG